MSEERIYIGPIALSPITPVNIINRLTQVLEQEYGNLDRHRITELSLTYDKFHRHFSTMRTYKEWVDSYELKKLVSFNCSHNQIISLREFPLFQFPNLETLNLSDCNIQNIEGLCSTNLPSLSTLILFNNHLNNLIGLRKCFMPFLMELISDSNHITSISFLSQSLNPHLQHVELQNNLIIDAAQIMKFSSGVNLRELRLENSNVVVDRMWKEVLEGKLKSKFINLE